MSARPIRLSLDSDLLDQIDADAEARSKGRSAFIRSAIEIYLRAKERRGIEERLSAAYHGRAETLLAEVEDLIGRQAWPGD